MRPPFAFIPLRLRRPLFLAALLWALFLFAIMQVLNQPLITPAAPAGIVSYELAGTPDRAAGILVSWQRRPEDVLRPPFNRSYLAAGFGLGFDYLFMPSYAIAIALGILLAASRYRGAFASIGAWLGWASLAAALFDASENYALWHMLQSDFPSSPWPQIAFACASLKFALITAGILYSLVGAMLPQPK